MFAQSCTEQNRTEVLQGAKQAATLQRNPVPRSHDSRELKTNPTSNRFETHAQWIP